MDLIKHKKIIDFVIRAGQRALQLRAAGLIIEQKPDGSIVTNADLDCNEMICAELRSLFPGMHGVSEEDKKLDPSGRYSTAWVTDPLDGTGTFARGEANFGILIGFVENGVPVHGFAYYPDPKHGVIYYTGADDGKAYKQTVKIEDGEPVFGPPIELMTQPATGELKVVQFQIDVGTILTTPFTEVRNHSYPLNALAVLEGHANLSVSVADTIADWDLVALDALARKSGAAMVYLRERTTLIYGQERPAESAYFQGSHIVGNVDTLKRAGLVSQEMQVVGERRITH